MSIGIVLADDHSSVRSMVRIILASQTRFRLKGEASDGDSAVALVGRERPSVAIVDIGLPGRCGLDSTREIRERFPSVQVLMLSAHNHCVYVAQALRAGACAYVVKQAMGQDLVTGVDAAARGHRYVSPMIPIPAGGWETCLPSPRAQAAAIGGKPG